MKEENNDGLVFDPYHLLKQVNTHTFTTYYLVSLSFPTMGIAPK